MRRPLAGGTGDRRAAGFTLVELTIVIAIVGIVVGLGFARFADPTVFRARGFASELAQVVSAGQRFAVAQRRTVWVRLDSSAGAVSLCLDSGCTTRIAPIPGGALQLATPSGVKLAGTGTTFSFDASGAPSGAPATIRLTDSAGTDLGMGISVEPGSGHVRSF